MLSSWDLVCMFNNDVTGGSNYSKLHSKIPDHCLPKSGINE